jgi:phage-related protein
MTYRIAPEEDEKPLVWLAGAIKSPPFSSSARVRAGMCLRLLQQGETLSLPCSRPMPVIGPGCHELRIVDGPVAWRIFYRVDRRAIVILAVDKKQSRATPRATIEACRHRLRRYEGWRWGI